jgi:hypothetical protein
LGTTDYTVVVSPEYSSTPGFAGIYSKGANAFACYVANASGTPIDRNWHFILIEDLLMPSDSIFNWDQGQSFHFLIEPLKATAWDGSSFSYSTQGKVKIDLSTYFGVPAGVKAVVLQTGIKDSDSENSNALIAFSPNDTANEWAGLLKITGLPSDVQYRDGWTIPCDANGDIYYQIVASGSGTMHVTIEIWGYWR